MITTIENKESYIIDDLKALYLPKAAWREVKKETIANCLHHEGSKAKGYKNNQIQLQPKILKFNP